MNKAKTKLTRQDAERLFEGLPAGATAKASSRPENPFGPEVSDVVKRVEDESALWKDNLITLPVAIELPRGYDSVSRMREAMTRALRVKWVREGKDEVVAEFPEGWTAIRPGSGPSELRDPSGVVRGLFGWAKNAELRLLPRYLIESQTNFKRVGKRTCSRSRERSNSRAVVQLVGAHGYPASRLDEARRVARFALSRSSRPAAVLGRLREETSNLSCCGGPLFLRRITRVNEVIV